MISSQRSININLLRLIDGRQFVLGNSGELIDGRQLDLGTSGGLIDGRQSDHRKTRVVINDRR